MKAHKFVADFGIERAKAVLGECESFKCVEKPTHFDIDLDIFIHEKDFVELDESDVDLSELKQVVESVEIVQRSGGFESVKAAITNYRASGDMVTFSSLEKRLADYELVESYKQVKVEVLDMVDVSPLCKVEGV